MLPTRVAQNPRSLSTLLRIRTALLLVLLCLYGHLTSFAATTSARIVGAVTSYGSSLTSAAGTAVDAAQNAYVVTSTGSVYKETFDATGNAYTEDPLFSVSGAYGIAVDRAGTNLFVGTGTSVVRYAGSGTTYALATTFGPFKGAAYPAVDSAGNVYIVDTTAGVLYKETLSGGSYAQTILTTGLKTARYLATDQSGNVFVNSGTTQVVEVSGTTGLQTQLTIAGLTGIAGLQVDSAGDLFIQSSSVLLEAVLSGTNTYTASSFYQYTGTGLAVDTAGNLYLNASTANNGTKLTVGAGYLDFGSVGPGSPAQATIAFTLLTSATGKLGTPTAVTQGLTGYDFNVVSGGTCLGASIVAGTSCTVLVQFQPLASGSRVGAVNLTNSAGSILASGFLGGVGFAPLAAYQSVTLLNTISTTLSQGRGLTVDPAGNVFVANSTASQILKFPAGSSTATVLATTTSTCSPVGTAVDGAGNVFYTCNHEPKMYELVGGTGTPVAITVGYDTDDHLSVDAAGNLYPTSYNGGDANSPSNLFLKVAAGSHTVSVLASAPASARFVGAVTDAAGNTFAPDYNNNILYELPAGASTLTKLYSGSPLVSPHAIAEDAAGNLYVTTTTPNTSGSGTSNLLRFSAADYTATPAIVAVPGADSLAITPNGNFYTVFNNSTLAVYTRSVFSLTFADTAVGQTSAAQTVTLENDGTAPLTLAVPANGSNPSISNNFTYGSSSTCPQLSSASTAATLAAGGTCTEVIAFAPQMAGTISGTMVTKDNSANVDGSTQSIDLSGTGTPGTPTVSVTNVSSTLGQTVTLTATVAGGGAVPTGAVTFQVGSGATVTATCTAGTGQEKCTASYATQSGPAAGANTITASVAQDGNYVAATGTGTLTLAPATTSSSVSSSTNPSTFGSSVVFTANVTSTYATPSGGTVTFLDGGNSIGTAVLDSTGKATLTTSTLAAGTHAISISYGGTSTFATSTSSVLNQSVNPASNDGNVLSSSNLNTTFGSPITLTDTLGVLGGTNPTGTVTFYSGTTALGSVTLNGSNTANLVISTLPVGTDTVKAVYSGDSNYNSTSSAPLLQHVSKASVSNTLASNNANPSFGTSVSFTATVPTVGGTTPTGNVTFSSGSLVLGTAALNASGVASLSTAALPVGTDSVTATYAGDGNYESVTSNSVTETVAKASGYSDVLSTSNASPAFGASVSLTVKMGAVNSTYPSGSVTFTSNGVSLGTATLTNGVATLSTTALTVGSDAVQATYAGDGNFANSSSNIVTETVSKADVASDVLSTSNTNPTFGASVTLTDKMTAVGTVYPTGSVNFYSGTTLLGSGTLNATGVATLSTGSLPVGTSSVSAVYAGDVNFNSTKSNAVTETVTKSNVPSDTLTTSDPAPAFGASITLTDALAAVNGVYPTGQVNFTLGGKLLGSATVSASGVATLSTNALPTGTSVLTAQYQGDTNFNTADSNTVTEVVAKVTGYGHSLSSSNLNPTFGSSITLTDSLAAVNNVYPTGNIVFKLGNTVIGTAPLNASGVASLSTSSLPVGSDTVTAAYGGDDTFAASSSNAVTETVAKAAVSSDVLTTSEAAPAFGAPVTLTDTLSALNGTYPTGTVTFYNGSSVLGTGTINASGVATLTTSALPPGSDAITASYPGDSTFANAASNALTETVAKASGANTLAVSNPNPVFGTSTTFTDTLATVGGVVPSGTVTFLSGSTVIGKGTVNSSGVATVSVSSLPVGTSTVTASYPGDNTYNPSTSNGVQVNVSKANVDSDTLTSSTLATTYGQNVTFTDTLASKTGAVPGGSITFFRDTTLLGTVPVDATGAASFTTSSLPVGTDAVHAQYSGDANFNTATSNYVTVVVAKIPQSTLDTVSGVGVYGASSTLVTVTIPYTGPTPPTGDILVADTHNESVTFAASTCVSINTALSCTANLPTTNEPVGSNALTVSQAADTNYSGSTGSGVLTVGKLAATTGDSASGTGTYGTTATPVSLSIPFAGTTPPMGAITLTDTHGNTVTIAASVCSSSNHALQCTANLPTATEPLGANAVTVSQAADANYSGSTGSGTVTINKAPATTNDTLTGTGTYGSATTAVSITIPFAGSASPTGAVTITDTYNNSVTVPASSCVAQSGTLSCSANLPTTSEPVGANTASVSQAGDANYSGSTGTGTITINSANGSNTDTASGSGIYGAASTAVTISIPFTGSASPSGLITLADTHGNKTTVQAASCTVNSKVLTCPATLPTANEPAGSNPVTVSQAADGNYSASSGTGTITLAKANGSAGDTATGAGTYGTATSPVTVSIPFSGAVAPTGAITLQDTHGNTVSVAASACTAAKATLTCNTTLATANEPVGSNSLVVSQAADSNYNASTGTGTLTIGKAAATSDDTVTGSGTYGASTSSVVITIPYAGLLAPTGLITVTDSLGHSVTLLAASCQSSGGALTCAASLPSSNDPVGTVPLTVSQAADVNYNGSTGSGTLSISPAGAHGDDSATGTGFYGAASTPITIVVPFTGATAPAGVITITDSHGNSLSVTATGCTNAGGALVCAASFPTANEPVGQNVLAVAQVADASHAASSGSGAIIINKATGSNTDTATGAGTYGAATSPVQVSIPFAGPVAPSGAVTVLDTLGNTASVAASTCTAASGSLTCTLHLPTANEPLGSNTVSVAQAADANYTSSTGSGTVTISAATTSPVGNSSSSVQNVTITQGTASTLLTLTLTYDGAAAPSGAITFTVAGGVPVTATCSAANASEVCTATYPTASLTAGAYTITASEAADGNYVAGSATGTLTVETGTVSPLLDSISNVGNVQIVAGTPSVTLSAQITFNGPVPTGGLTFTLPGGTPVTATCTTGGSPLSCTAVYPTGALEAGTYIITATEAADTSYPQGAATSLLTISPDASTPVSPVLTTGSAVSNVLIAYGAASANLSATIQYNGPAPTGAVSFTVVGAPAGTVLAACSTGAAPRVCTASYPTSTLGVGSYRIQADEAADSNYPAGTGIGTLTVTDLIGGTDDAATGNGHYGDVTSPITVSIPYSGTAAPTGTVTVNDDHGNTASVPASACTAANAVLTCTVALPSATLPVGTDPLQVNQSADGAYAATTGSGSLTVGKATATTNDSASGSGTYGDPSTPITVTLPYAGVTAPTGLVTVADSLGNTTSVDGSTCSGAKGVLTCTVTLATANEPVGTNTVTISQAADSNYSGSNGSGSVAITRAGAKNSDTATGKGSYGAATSTVNVTIPFSGTTAPTGAITVTDTQGNTVTTPASGCTVTGSSLFCSAALPTANEPVGDNTLNVSQAADSNHEATSGTGLLSIGKASVTSNDSANGNGTYGAPTSSVTVVVPYAGMAAPSGSITVTDTLGNTATINPSTCIAASGKITCTVDFATANEVLGPNSLSVIQAPDANYAGSNGTGTNILSRASITSADSATGTGTYGATATPVTVTTAYNGNTAPTGAITVADTLGNSVTVQAATCSAAKKTLTCTANLPTATEPVGNNAVSVTEAGDANYSGSTGAGTVTITKAPVTNADAATGSGTYGAATTSVLVTLPYAGAAAPTGAVTVADTFGNTVTVQAASCTASAGVLTCTVTFPTASESVGSNDLSVAQAGDSNYSGSTGNGKLTLAKAGTGADTVAGTGSYGDATTPVTVTIPYTGSVPPTGSISLSDSFGNSASLQAANCSAAKGMLTCTGSLSTASEPVGSNSITVSQAADANYASSTGTGTVILTKAQGGTGDTATGSGSYGATTIPVTVSIPFVGTAAPSGAVTVSDSHGDTVTVPAASCSVQGKVLLCSANLPSAGLPVGDISLQVTQAADANYNGSTGSGSVNVSKATPTLAAPTVTPLNAPAGTSVTLTQMVPAGETGTVTFFNGSTALGTANIVNGVATLTTDALPQGTDILKATANGDGQFASASSPAVTDVVGGNASTVTLSSSQGTTTIGTAVTFTAKVTGSSPATGTVTFFDGGTAIGTAAVSNGVAVLNTAALTTGTHTITATFTPDANTSLTGSTSAAVTETVQAAGSSLSLSSSLNPAIVGQTVTFRVNVPSTVAGVVPTGMVTFFSGTQVLGTAQLDGSGTASLNTSDLPAGAQNITASYAGDTIYAPSASQVIAQAVADYNVGNTTPTIAVDPGQTAAFNLTINPVANVAFSAPVVLTVTGLPANYNVSFAPATLTPGSGGTTSTMSVQTFAQVLTAMQHQQHVKSLEAALAWAGLLPLLGLRRVRRRLPKALLGLLVCLASFGAVAPLTGCGGGYFGPAPASYTLTVTGTSGSLQRSTTVTLNLR